MKIYLLFIITCCFVGCRTETTDQAQQIVDQAIAAHGGDRFQQLQFSFDFREKHYEVDLDQGRFTYESTGPDSTGQQVHDVLTNETFSRTVDGQSVSPPPDKEAGYRNSLNSVVYFVLLPYPLNDPAVKKEYLGKKTVRGEPYHKIRVTFSEAEGGDDYDDEYVYWFHQQHHTLDYLAYSFQVNGGGTRFREAYNVRQVQGIRFVDYINYESTITDFELENYDALLEEGQVKELSRIETENVRVDLEKTAALR